VIKISRSGRRLESAPTRLQWLGYVMAGAACALTTIAAALLESYFDLANIVMLFLLTVVLIAVAFGRGPAVIASFISVALFDFFFVPPTLSFTVADAQYLLTFAVMLAVALMTAHLTAGLKQQAHAAALREERTRALYETARELTGALTVHQAARIVRHFLRDAVEAESVVFVEAEGHRFAPVTGEHGKQDIQVIHIPADELDVRYLVENVAATGCRTVFDSMAYFPIKAAERARGVLVVSFGGDPVKLQENAKLIEAVASLMAIVVERLHYVDVARARELEMQAERLRSSILSALSHDIRTPLTALTGLADSLVHAKPGLAPQQREFAEALRAQAMRLNRLVANLLDMAKLNAGRIRLRKEWQPVEEVIGSSLTLLEGSLAAHVVHVDVPEDLPLLEFDAVLVERVLCNLLENAGKYAPPGTRIELSARDAGDAVEVTVRDHGPGVPESGRAEIFDMFVRGEKESTRPGVGLGLAICRAIVEAHGGTIAVVNESGGGARFTFTLPKGQPPAMCSERQPAPLTS
jgi:two-component system sensor histidine kinase KdpD